MTMMVSPIPYLACRNLATVNDLWSPIPYMEFRNLVTVNDLWSPIPNMEYGDLLPGSPMYDVIFQVPHTLYGMLEPCNCQ